MAFKHIVGNLEIDGYSLNLTNGIAPGQTLLYDGYNLIPAHGTAVNALLYPGNDLSSKVQAAFNAGNMQVMVPSGDYTFGCQAGGPLFVPNATYSVGQNVYVPLAYVNLADVVYRCVKGGQAGAVGPLGLGLNIVSGQTIWHALGYSQHGLLPFWYQSTAYIDGYRVFANGGAYQAIQAGTSASSGSGPIGLNNFTDGGVIWKFVGDGLGPIIIPDGGSLYLSTGTYDNNVADVFDWPNMCTIIAMGNNTTLRGAGWSNTIMYEAHATHFNTLISAVTDISLLTLTALQGAENIHISDIQFAEIATATSEVNGCIQLGNVTRATVERCFFNGVSGGAVWFGSAADDGYCASEVAVINNNTKRVAAQVFACVNGRNFRIDSNHIVDAGRDNAYSTYIDLETNATADAQSTWSISNNIFDATFRYADQSAAGYAVQIASYGTGFMGILSNNVVLGGSDGYYQLIGTSGVGNFSIGENIYFPGGGTFNAASATAVVTLVLGTSAAPILNYKLTGNFTNFVSGNAIRGNTSGATCTISATPIQYGFGVGIIAGFSLASCSNTIIEGNVFNKVGSTAIILTNCTNVTVRNNSCSNTAVFGSYGAITVSDSTHCRIQSNSIFVDLYNNQGYSAHILEFNSSLNDYNYFTDNDVWSQGVSPLISLGSQFYASHIEIHGVHSRAYNNRINGLPMGSAIRNISDLQTLGMPPFTNTDKNVHLSLAGTLNPADGSGGSYYWNQTDARADNGIDVIRTSSMVAIGPGGGYVANLQGRWNRDPECWVYNADGYLTANTLVKLDGYSKIIPFLKTDVAGLIWGVVLDNATNSGDKVRVVNKSGTLCTLLSDGYSTISTSNQVSFSTSVDGYAVTGSANPIGIAYTDTFAIGSITSSVQSAYHNNDSFTLNDGVNTAKVFEYKVDGYYVQSGTNITIDISAAVTAANVSADVLAVLQSWNQQTLLTIKPSQDRFNNTKINLVQDVAGSAGNITITTGGLNPDVVTGMSNATIGAPFRILFKN